MLQSDFWVPLVCFIGKLLCVCIIFANTNEINFKLEWAISFVSQSKPNGVNL